MRTTFLRYVRAPARHGGRDDAEAPALELFLVVALELGPDLVVELQRACVDRTVALQPEREQARLS